MRVRKLLQASLLTVGDLSLESGMSSACWCLGSDDWLSGTEPPPVTLSPRPFLGLSTDAACELTGTEPRSPTRGSVFSRLLEPPTS